MVSPFAPKTFPLMPEIQGMSIATHSLKGRYHPRENILFLHFPQGAQLAGVTTQASIVGAPVEIARERMQEGMLDGLRGVIINAGNANVCTGDAGLQHVREITRHFAQKFGYGEEKILMASTGVIGEMLEPKLFTAAIDNLSFPHTQQWQSAAQAILTTDTYPKAYSTTLEWNEKTYHIAGIAKGSGMISPHMATMLGFIVTDLPLPAQTLKTFLQRAIPSTFNAITVDGDTSTSDMVLAIASGVKPCVLPLEQQEHIYPAFYKVCQELALQIVKDGEGIQKLIKVSVKGAANKKEAQTFAYSVASSLLVKTAIHGEDLNWGRVAMALGKTGLSIDTHNLTISFGDHALYKKGNIMEQHIDSCQEHLQSKEIVLTIDLASGQEEYIYYTSDLSKEYIDINASYRS